MIIRILLLISLTLLLPLTGGCAEGLMWKTGRFSPWARNKWAEEERIADTLFTKKRRMDESVAGAKNGPLEQRQQVAAELGEVILRDTVLLTRIHAIRLLGQLDSPAADEVLESASRDFNADIRIAAIDAWQYKSADSAIPVLQGIINSDTNIDVRIAATRALGSFKGTPAIEALTLAINDTDPALQLRAADSLRLVTGQPFGRNVAAWQEFVQQRAAAGPGVGSPDGSPNPAETADRSTLGELFKR